MGWRRPRTAARRRPSGEIRIAALARLTGPCAIDDLHAMLLDHGEWMLLGNADEQKEAKEGTVEAWGRSDGNPVAAGTG